MEEEEEEEEEEGRMEHTELRVPHSRREKEERGVSERVR